MVPFRMCAVAALVRISRSGFPPDGDRWCRTAQSAETAENQGVFAISATSAVSSSSSGDVESIEIHHLVPGGGKVAHELPVRIVARVDLRERTELRVRSEDEVNAGAGPLALTIR